jgi:hypothetical protein
MNYQTLVFGDRHFKLIRTLPETPKFAKGISDLKLLWHCDTVLKKNGMLYFCRAIENIEYEELS